MKDKILLFTLGNVITKGKTKYSLINETVDTHVNKRSQELYDLLYDKFNIAYWACGRYGQREYSKELGVKWGKKVNIFMNKLKKENCGIDFAIQMCGHPNIQHEIPYYIIVDYLPYGVDLSLMDTQACPYYIRNEEHEQDHLYRNAKGIIVYSPIHREMLINFLNLNPEKVTAICPGVDAAEQEDFDKKPEKIVLWVGSDYERKGGEVVLEAFKRLYQRDSEFSLYMVGVDINIDYPNVHVIPFLHDKDIDYLYDLYKRAMIYVMPSYREPLGLVYLEAMSFKTPVIVTTRGGMAEMIKRSNSGIVVKPGDVDAVYNEMIKLISDEEYYRTISENGFKFAHNNARLETAGERIRDAITRWQKNLRVQEDYIIY